jgi:predicted  nucleic acid-binding Zn-ribbon protein
VSDVTYALPGGGRCVLLPGGIEQYLAERSAANGASAARPLDRSETASARERKAGKQLSRIESQLRKLDDEIAKLHLTMADAAADHVRLGALNAELGEMVTRKESLEEQWLTLADD